MQLAYLETLGRNKVRNRTTAGVTPPADINSTRLVMNKPLITLTGAQLRDALAMCGDDMETKIAIVHRDSFISSDGESKPAGFYAYDEEYFEEGINGPLGFLDGSVNKALVRAKIESLDDATREWLFDACDSLASTNEYFDNLDFRAKCVSLGLLKITDEISRTIQIHPIVIEIREDAVLAARENS